MTETLQSKTGVPSFNPDRMIVINDSHVSLDSDSNVFYYVDQDGVALPGEELFRSKTGAAGTNYTLTEWQAAGFDVNSVEADPLFTDLSTGDLTLLSTNSPAAFENLTEAAGVVVVDNNGDTRYGGIDGGGFQIQRHPTVSVVISK